MPILRCLILFFSAIVFAGGVYATATSSCKKLVGEEPDLPFVVVGRVVDSEGSPVANSSVSLDPRGSTEFLNPYESAITGNDGCFKLTGFGDKKARTFVWFLYTTDNYNFPGIARINPPFVGHLRRLDSRYNGIPFFPGNRKVIDLGDVPIVFRYGSARLKFDNCPKNKCSSVIQWGTAEVSIVHCRSNTGVDRGTFSREELKQYIYNQDRDLIFMLPLGRWKVQFYNGYESFRKDELVAETACFDVKLNEVLDVPVRLTRINRP